MAHIRLELSKYGHNGIIVKFYSYSVAKLVMVYRQEHYTARLEMQHFLMKDAHTMLNPVWYKHVVQSVHLLQNA